MKAYKYNNFTVELVQNNPHLLFIYGDNLERRGKRGQAVIRDLPNTIGIATKHSPSMRAEAFFKGENKEYLIIDREMRRLEEALDSGVYTGAVLPTNGLGTGLAELQRRAPKVLEYLEARMVTLLSSKVTNLKG